ncbi:Regulatory protein GAL4 [Fulvia fulva]|uniref:Regulatory protein GAL4 n=1 Tax=Passalora fulva TaxID=5499 RepID=A0A9Q8LFL7_PASFU|nr:Regulatory protein GAL4 [Fulvia fulva]KAK4615585.1 Regulatory protein GAL4 [Fulvia fulva]KAK4616860.1 Regulatory protein GAL4 [Fulvia fulva]UJO16526.1 Regulatory protein GAL4 [Fulvia fulva]WPV18996.1 Regulatory protein GAL4 [Fulvia fulva]WPV34240.1 Regulatory protein GAL4 [Fulvia fulva]
MGFLTTEASKSGYTGPQSGIAALKLLRSLPSGQHHGHTRLTAVGTTSNTSKISNRQRASIDQYISDYFTYFHPAYSLLHEGLFRARLFGAVAKPRDGSWPLLYNMVIAMGAFAGDLADSDIDWHFYQIARNSIALSVIEKGSLSYVQGLAIMANYLQKRDKPNAGFSLIGIAWSMAMAIGPHRELGTASTTSYIMEQRRRTWWTLFCFVSGAQLTLGRPPASGGHQP